MRNILLTAVVAALPLAATAQSGTSSGSTQPSSSDTRSSSRTGSSQSDSYRSGTSSSTSSPSTGSSMGAARSSSAQSTSTTGSTSAVGTVTRIDQATLEQQFTATDLIGKTVHDSAGKKVGEVRDIVLGSGAGTRLAIALADASRESPAGSTRTGSSGSTNPSSGSDVARSQSGASSSIGDSAPGGAAGARSQEALSGLASEPAAIVSVGGFMGMGDNLLRVPLSQLNYDSANQRLALALSESEIADLTTDRSVSHSATE